jgi:hypothetical protein
MISIFKSFSEVYSEMLAIASYEEPIERNPPVWELKQLSTTKYCVLRHFHEGFRSGQFVCSGLSDD